MNCWNQDDDVDDNKDDDDDDDDDNSKTSQLKCPLLLSLYCPSRMGLAIL